MNLTREDLFAIDQLFTKRFQEVKQELKVEIRQEFYIALAKQKREILAEVDKKLSKLVFELKNEFYTALNSTAKQLRKEIES